MHESFLVYKGYRWLKISTLLVLISLIAYWWHDPPGGPNGGTWLGYTLGGLGLAIILLLLWLGVRKRRFPVRGDSTAAIDAGKAEATESGGNRVVGWLSAHVYLGLALLVIGTLHSGFQVGWNVHTLAYGLMVVVILSGVYGVWNYARLPRVLTENRRGMTRQGLMEDIGNIDRECLSLADRLGGEAHETMLYAINNTWVGGSARRQLFPPATLVAHEAATQSFRERLAQSGEAEAAETLDALIESLSRKRELVRRLQRDAQFQAMLEVWLYVHVPLSVALLAALSVHVVSVFLYW